jgi:CRISPR-associated protein Csm2
MKNMYENRNFLQGRDNPGGQQKDWSKDFKLSWITNGLDEDAINYLNDFGKELARRPEKGDKSSPLTTSQFRNVYGELKRIQLKGLQAERASFMLLRPKLAYAKGRHGDKNNANGIDKFKLVFDKAIEPIKWTSGNQEELNRATVQFKNFMDCMEALLAYHKAHGGD